MPVSKNIVVEHFADRALQIDVFTPTDKINFPVAIFIPGFKGFKDWGYFPYLHEVFTSEGIGLITINFSHNGISKSNHTEFTDLQGFASNTISAELAELKLVVDWVVKNAETYSWDPGAISLIGHSRGGGEAIIHSAKDNRINRLICWAPIIDFANGFENVDIENWQKQGFIQIENTRTHQQMPVNYAFWEDFQKNKTEFDVLHAASLIEIPMLIMHGEEDKTVAFSNSEKIYEYCLHALLILVPKGTHTFNAGHPWTVGAKFPFQLQEVLVNTTEFIIG